MCLISVIMPVYNSEPYLIDSMNSLINQTIFEKLEILAIDDGSTDDSMQILLKYKKKYNNIKVFHQENKGVSAARNMGLKNACGQYIAFFDSDDKVDDIHFENLLGIIQSGEYDVGIGNYKMIFPDGYKKERKNRKEKVWTNANEVVIDFFRGDLICNNPIDKIFTKKVIGDELFPEGYAIGEDMYFIYKILKKSKKIKLDSFDATYNYIFRKNSAMKGGNIKECHLDGIRLSHKIWENEKNINLKRYAEANYIHEICKFINRIQGTSRETYNAYYGLVKKDLDAYSILKAYRYMNKKHFMAFFLMRISPRLYSIVYKVMRIG